MSLQGTRKMRCMAHFEVKGFTLYPEYGINQCEKVGLTKWKVQCLKEDKLKEFNKMLRAKNPVKTEAKYYVSFPSNEAHSEDPIGLEAIHTQKSTPKSCSKNN